MNAADLARELAAAHEALSDAQHEDFVLAGVDRLDIALGLVGAAYGSVAGERFEPHPDGRLAFCTPARIHRSLTIESPVPDSAVRVGELVDLVYWSLNHPERWAMRTGAAECLGLVEPQYCGPEPVAIHRRPLGWLRGGCRGLVLLTRDPWAMYRILCQCSGGLIAEDERHAAELAAALDHPWPHPPEIIVRERRNAL
jgi:hypothetical protein